jgi:6-phosphogluconolactonase (cycloisomerase 2 family)
MEVSMPLHARIFLLGITLSALCIPLAAQSTQPIFVFVANGSTSSNQGLLSVFEGDPTTGALSVVPGSPFQVGSDAEGVAVDPTGRFVYVLDNVSNSVWGYSVDPTTGAPTLLPGAPLALPTGFNGASASSIAIDPTGRFMYVGGEIRTANVITYMAAYSLDPTTGIPTTISGSPLTFNDTADTSALTIDQSGTFIYAPYYVTSYSINFETGVPSLIAYNLDDPSGMPVAVDPLGGLAAEGNSTVSIDPNLWICKSSLHALAESNLRWDIRVRSVRPVPFCPRLQRH